MTAEDKKHQMAQDDHQPKKATDDTTHDTAEAEAEAEADAMLANVLVGQGYMPPMGMGPGLEEPEAEGQRKAWHKFWNKQPVCSLMDMLKMTNDEDAESILNQTVDDVPVEPTPLNRTDQTDPRSGIVEKLAWHEIDLDDQDNLNEVYELLRKNYVEDDGANFRFEYSKEFLRWALLVPGKRKEWHICLRSISSGRMVAFVSAVPVVMNLHGKTVTCVEINFLCAIKGLRHLGLAPLLITEITRRVRRTGIFHAVYTSGTPLPGSFVECRYYHRTLNFAKLYACGFTDKPRSMTTEKLMKYLRVPTAPQGIEAGPDGICGEWRYPEQSDAPAIMEILKRFYQRTNVVGPWKGASYDSAGKVAFSAIDKFKNELGLEEQKDAEDTAGSFRCYPEYTEDEVAHLLLCGNDVQSRSDPVVRTRVRVKNGQLTDFISYYSLPSQVLNTNHAATSEPHNYTHLYAAYQYLSAGTELSTEELLQTNLHFAHKDGFDVFNALNMGNHTEMLLKRLRFGVGDGSLHHYAFNWKGPKLYQKDIGLILC